MLGEKKCWVKKKLVKKNVGQKETFRQKKIGVNFFGGLNKFLGKKKFRAKNFSGEPNFRVKKKFEQKNFGRKIVSVEKKCRPCQDGRSATARNVARVARGISSQ